MSLLTNTSVQCLTCPDNGFGTGMNLSHGTLVQTAGAVNAHELITGRGIPVKVLAELDRKVDDGAAVSGLMQVGVAGNNWVAAESAACINDPDYQLLTPSDNCAAVFRNF